jgi:hypothetical protein
MVADLEAILTQEPLPTITITCHKVPVPGQVGNYVLQPELTFMHMPSGYLGGWDMVFQVLLQCQQKVAEQMVTAGRQTQQRRIEVATMVPPNVLKH